MMNKAEKLLETKNKLKSEFIGLDEIIEKVIDSITPWYLTPEILERPVVVSLWGLTGTGKTSLIRKLVNYLDLSGKTLFFDCGEQGGFGTRLFSDKLEELFDSSGLSVQENDPRYYEKEFEVLNIDTDLKPSEKTRNNPLDFAFVFDEFQYLRVKNKIGEEKSRPEGRAIWSLMDSGIIDINSSNYSTKSFIDYFDDIEAFNELYPDTRIEYGRFRKEDTELLMNHLTFLNWTDSDEDPEEKGCRLIFSDSYSFLVKRLNFLKKGLGVEVGKKIYSFTRLGDYVEYLRGLVELILRPRLINCSKSLIFVLGNLDEAFNLGGEDFDPDIDADVFHEITSKVNCMDIKTALRTRFRDEQIGRLGNNMIIYPSLRRCDFEQIIEKELSRIRNKFKDNYSIEINFSEKFKKLMYTEGCFPIQGVRPLFSTINYLVSPMLSLISTSGELSPVTIDVDEKTTTNISQVKLVVLKGEERIGDKTIQLNLSALRSPERCKKIGLQAVHEASHAVLYALLTGENPSAIVASNIFGNGGYMMHETKWDSSVTSINELRTTVIVSLAGYYGERAFFEESYCSLGATSDLENVWKNLRNAYYIGGLYIPLCFSESNVSNENHGLPHGFPVRDTEVNDRLMKFFQDCCTRTKEYIRSEMNLIAEISKYLVANRNMSTEVFKKFVDTYGITFNTIKRQDKNYYNKMIEKWIQKN